VLEVIDPVAALPARSSSVVAGVNTNRPVRTFEESALHEPEHVPVTVKVTVRFELLSTTEPAYVTFRVVLELVR